MYPSPLQAPVRHLALTLLATAGLALGSAPAASAQSSFGGPFQISGGTITHPVQTTPSTQAPVAQTPADSDVAGTRPAPGPVVAQIYAATNAERAKVGAGPVHRNFALEDLAQRWSQTQAREDRMYHNPNLATEMPAGWWEYGENVLQNWNGVDGNTLVAQWMASPPHKANLLNPMHTDLGVGLATAASTKLYSTQNFGAFR